MCATGQSVCIGSIVKGKQREKKCERKEEKKPMHVPQPSLFKSQHIGRN